MASLRIETSSGRLPAMGRYVLVKPWRGESIYLAAIVEGPIGCDPIWEVNEDVYFKLDEIMEWYDLPSPDAAVNATCV